jgi:hypothetical protein
MDATERTDRTPFSVEEACSMTFDMRATSSEILLDGGVG